MAVSLLFEIDAALAEELSDALLEAGALSVSIADAQAGTSQERALFDEPGSERATWARARIDLLCSDERGGLALVRDASAALGLPAPQRIKVEPVTDRDWVRATQAQFGPIRVSGRMWIVPSWQRPPDPAAINIVIDPGQAFGTGSHPTTLLCLEWLEREIRGGETVVDYGCGSGILAIAACKAGAGRVIGVDIDPRAVETARQNAALNDVNCDFRVADEPFPLPADIVIANILANPLIVLAPALSKLLRPGGRIALSGILASQQNEVATAYGDAFDLDPVHESEGWVRVSGTKR